MITFFFAEGPVRNFHEAKKSDTVKFGAFFRAMLDHGVYLAPSQFEALFVSACVGPAELDHFLNAAKKSLDSIND